jgi:hypothetical protein
MAEHLLDEFVAAIVSASSEIVYEPSAFVRPRRRA